jgi:preprotein translocase subunit SecA
MTGTADTEALEFKKIYKLDVAVIPTHKPMIRLDYNDSVYRTEREKFNAVVDEIKSLHTLGRPVLVGTTSIEKSEKLNKMLEKLRINHQVLNAKQHEREAEIVAQAGRIGSVTIATNMAGRGTDILLGGNPEFLARDIARRKFKVELQEADPHQFEEAMLEAKGICENEKKRVLELGGLQIIGTERHEARRIDNQLRGRSGRQGDPGSSRFYVSLEDELMRLFASDRISGIMGKLGWQEGEPIEHKLITKSIENAQKRVEARNFDIRKHLLEYDDVLNTQRDVVYTRRKEILSGGNLKESLYEMADELSREIVPVYVPEKMSSDGLDLKGLGDAIFRDFNVHVNFEEISLDGLKTQDVIDLVIEKVRNAYEEKESQLGEETLRHVERYIMLQTLDYLWKDHLLSMDHLREGIGLRGYAQKDPLYEYKKEGYEMFSGVMDRFREEACEKLFRVRPVSEVDMERLERRRRLEQDRMVLSRGEGEERRAPIRRERKIGRNDPCHCGSGKKYKKCCGRAA